MVSKKFAVISKLLAKTGFDKIDVFAEVIDGSEHSRDDNNNVTLVSSDGTL